MNQNIIEQLTEQMKTSPIRNYLKDKKEATLFEEERTYLEEIDKIIAANAGNRLNPLKVVVLGEVKAGKSTLVNALVGKKISYTNVVEATATILEICYSDKEKITIKNKNETMVTLDSLTDMYALMDENRENQAFFEKINKITVETPTERLEEITLVDTPGLSTITAENAGRTDAYIANSDVIVWVLSAHHLGQSDITQKIEEVMDYGKPILCVVNRIDEVDGSVEDILAYVDNEMGYMFHETFTVSAKQAWEGYYTQDPQLVESSQMNQLYDYMVTHIERNSKQVQQEGIEESTKVQALRDLKIHKYAYERTESLMHKIESDIKEFERFNRNIKGIIHNRIQEWIDTRFLAEEKQLLMGASNDEELRNNLQKYLNETYIEGLVKEEYNLLSEYILQEWGLYADKIINKKELNWKPLLKLGVETYAVQEIKGKQDEAISGLAQGGVTGGAVGLGLAGYAAVIGPGAAYITIGSAMSAFLPPLLIAGAVGGLAWKMVTKDKNKSNRYNQIDAIIFEVRNKVKQNLVKDIIYNLESVSDNYHTQATNMILEIINQCNITQGEVRDLVEAINKYTNKLEYYIQNK